jgi:hypothetical protein
MDTSNFAILLKYSTNSWREDETAIKGIEKGFINPDIKEQVLKALNHFDKFVRADISGQEEETINTNLKDLYRAIFEFKVANADSKVANARVVDFAVAGLRKDEKPLLQMVQFGKWVDKIIQKGIEKSDNEDIRHLATLSKAVGSPSIKVEGNTDTDLLIALHGITSDHEIGFTPGTGFKITFGREGDSVKVLSSKFGSADNEGVYTLDYDDPDNIEQFGLDAIFEMIAEESEAGLAMSRFEDLIHAAVEDGTIDPFDLDNVTIEIKA